MDNQTELAKRVAEFLHRFEMVFDNDWAFTKDTIFHEYVTSTSGTFLNPSDGVGGDGTNRAGLIDAYLDLRAFAISEGIYNSEFLE